MDYIFLCAPLTDITSLSNTYTPPYYIRASTKKKQNNPISHHDHNCQDSQSSSSIYVPSPFSSPPYYILLFTPPLLSSLNHSFTPRHPKPQAETQTRPQSKTKHSSLHAHFSPNLFTPKILVSRKKSRA